MVVVSESNIQSCSTSSWALEPRIERYNFSNSLHDASPVLEQVGALKTFRIKRKNSINNVETMIRFSRLETKGILDKVGKKFNIKNAHVVFSYAIKGEDGEEKIISVGHEHDTDLLDEAHEIFYIQAEPRV